MRVNIPVMAGLKWLPETPSKAETIATKESPCMKAAMSKDKAGLASRYLPGMVVEVTTTNRKSNVPMNSATTFRSKEMLDRVVLTLKFVSDLFMSCFN